MDRAGLWDYEKVLVCDVDNGERWETYVLPAERGSGRVSVQGAGAKLCEPGHCIIVLAFGVCEQPIEPTMILVDRENKFVQFLDGTDGPPPIQAGKKFDYEDTEAFYDAEDSFYRSFWDSEGSLHWGVFDDATGPDFLKACENLNRMAAAKAGLGPDSHVLDLGCGNGTVAAWLSKTFGCRVTGVDLSGVRIENARALAQKQPPEISEKLAFAKASAINLPYPDDTFTHVWSQAVIYHVHDKDKALREVHRVLRPGGKFVFDDLLKPRQAITDEARTHVYDRLLFDTDFSFHSYQHALAEIGFKVRESHDISPHLKTSYECLAAIAGRQANGAGTEKYHQITKSYRRMAEAVEREDLGWGLYVCEK